MINLNYVELSEAVSRLDDSNKTILDYQELWVFRKPEHGSWYYIGFYFFYIKNFI